MTHSLVPSKLALLVGVLLIVGGSVLALRVDDASGSAAQHERLTSPASSPIPADRGGSPLTFHDGLVRLTESLHQGNATAVSLDVRLSKSGVAVVPRGRSVNSQLPDWLQCLGAGRRVYWPPSLEVLFCTWQT